VGLGVGLGVGLSVGLGVEGGVGLGVGLGVGGELKGEVWVPDTGSHAAVGELFPHHHSSEFCTQNKIVKGKENKKEKLLIPLARQFRLRKRAR
jgi:hypothetical protein